MPTPYGDGPAPDTVSVVIPTLGASIRLAGCLEALNTQTLGPGEVVVVSAGHVRCEPLGKPRIPIKYLSSPGPALFCRLVNCGITATNGAWILLLNDDVILAPPFLERLLAGIPLNKRVGMACGKLLAPDGRTIDSTGQFVSRARTAFERGHGHIDRGQFETPDYVFSAPGAAALYRRSMLEALAVSGTYFDETLGMYLEDLDLGWRAQRAGWRVYYVPDAVASHARGATAKTRHPRWSWLRGYYLPHLSPELQSRYILNRYALMKKYDSPISLLWDGPWILWYEVRLWAYLCCCEWETLGLLWNARLRA